MKKFKQILSLIAEERYGPDRENFGKLDFGKLFGPGGKFSPKSAPREPTFRARMRSGNLTPNPDRPSGMEELLRRNPPEKGQKEPTARQRIGSGEINYELTTPTPKPSRTKKPSAAKRPTGSFPVVTNNMHHEGHLMRMIENDRELREMMRSVSPRFMKHSDRLTAALREYHEFTNGKASKYERGLFAHNLITSHLDDVSYKIAGIHPRKGLPIDEKFGEARISHFTQDTSFPGERTLKIHFHPLKTYISGAGQIKELTQYLEKKTGHSVYIHPDSGQKMVGTKGSPLVVAMAINHPWLRGEDDGGGGGGNEPVTPKPKNPTGRQPTGPRAPTRPRMPSLV
jgi:hypothetical protein